MANHNDIKENTKQSRWILTASGLLIVGLVVAYFTVPAINQFFTEVWQVLTSNDEQRIKNWVQDSFSWYGPLIIVLLMVVQMFLLVVPTPLIILASVLAYGPFWGTVIIVVAVFVASTVGYWIGRALGPNTIAKLIGGKNQKIVIKWLEKYGFGAVVITRVSPFFSNDAISFVAGLLGMRYWKFMASTVLGILPLSIAFAWLGQNSQRLKDGLVWGSVGFLVLIAAYFIIKRLRQKRRPPQDEAKES